MTTDPTITASLAAACAAHDRHRLDVLDALLDEAAPTAVRELLGAALDLCATLRTERDEREEAIGATFAKHRAEIDAATAQLAAARQVTGGAVTLPAQDRAEELARLIAVEPIRTGEWKALVERTRAALVSLGAPATTPPAAIDRSLALTAASLLSDVVRNGGLAEGGEIGPRASDYLDMMRRLETTPTAAPGLVAAVSVEELAKVYSKAYDEIGDRIRAIGAVLARLDATTIAPVDPEAVARAYHDHEDAPTPEWEEVNIWRGRDQDEQRAAISAMRATLTAAGIPVTPEVGK